MYKIIGADQREYGPVSADQINQWIAQGRINAQTKRPALGGDWKALSEFPEFTAAFADGSVQQITSDRLAGLRWNP
jgi:hypothetical protein